MKISYSNVLKERLKQRPHEKELEESLDKKNSLLDKLIEEVDGNKNRYLFYCPDVPFPLRTVITIYQLSIALNELGYNSFIIHEEKGFLPRWLLPEYLEKGKVKYLNQETRRKSKTKTSVKSIPSFKFKQNDTIIVPDGFWPVMENLNDIKIKKIVLAMSYDGMAVAPTGANWSHLGFKTVLAVSDNLYSDYQSIWPALDYKKLPFYIEEYKSVDPLTIKPVIALFCRDRKQAAAIINIFYGNYPFLNFFQFKIIRNIAQQRYIEDIENSAIVVVSDPNTGCNVPVIEALAAGKPVIAVYDRGFSHVAEEDVMFVANDNFEITNTLATFCDKWLNNPSSVFKTQKKNNVSFTKENTENVIKAIFPALQDELKTSFSIIKQTLNNE